MQKADLIHHLPFLRYFCDAAIYGGVSAAAKRNHVTQSAVSQGIRKLEEALGRQLTTHHPNRFHLNPEGDAILKKGLHLLKELSDWEETLISESDEISGKLEFACTHSFALAMLAKPLKQLQERHPKLSLSFKLARTDLIKKQLKRGEIDLGIVIDNDDFSDFRTELLGEGEYGLYATKKSLNPQKLPFILSEDRIETYLLKSSYEKKYKKALPLLMTVSSWQVIANFTDEGLGVGFFPDYVASNRRNKLLKVEFGLPPIPYRLIAILPKGESLSRHTVKLLESLRQAWKQL